MLPLGDKHLNNEVNVVNSMLCLHSVYDLFISDVFQDNTNVWTLGKSLINLPELQIMLLNYSDRDIAVTLYKGFLYGFKIHYREPRTAVESKI